MGQVDSLAESAVEHLVQDLYQQSGRSKLELQAPKNAKINQTATPTQATQAPPPMPSDLDTTTRSLGSLVLQNPPKTLGDEFKTVDWVKDLSGRRPKRVERPMTAGEITEVKRKKSEEGAKKKASAVTEAAGVLLKGIDPKNTQLKQVGNVLKYERAMLAMTEGADKRYLKGAGITWQTPEELAMARAGLGVAFTDPNDQAATFEKLRIVVPSPVHSFGQGFFALVFKWLRGAWVLTS